VGFFVAQEVVEGVSVGLGLEEKVGHKTVDSEQRLRASEDQCIVPKAEYTKLVPDLVIQ
jgi:hypothetical protein